MPAFGAVPYAEQGRYQSPYGLTISDLILKRGDAQADAIRQAGQVAGQTIANVGKSVTGALAERSQRLRDAPRLAAEQQARVLEIQQARGQIAAQQRAAADQGALDTAVGAGGDDPDAIEKQLPGHLRPVFRKSWNEAQAAKVALTKAQGEVQAALFDHVGAMAAAAKTMGAGHPEVIASLLDDAKKAGDPEADRYTAMLQQNPASADSILNALIQRSPTQTKIVGEGQDRTLRQQQEQRAILTQQQTAADREADNKRADAVASETRTHDRAMEANAAATLAASSGPVDISADVRTTSTGRKFLDLSLYQGKARDRAREAATASGAIPVSKENADALREIENARLNQQSILDQVTPLLPKDPTGRVIGAATRKMGQVLQTNDQRAAFASWRTAAIQTLRATAGSKGLRINQAEIAQAIENDIPTLNDTVSAAQQKVKNINTMLDNAETATLGALKGTGAAVTGPKNGDKQSIPGIPGAEATFTGGKWVRTK